jgi:hypothetical protein
VPFAWLANIRWERRYVVFTGDGSSSGEANYAVPIEPGDLIAQAMAATIALSASFRLTKKNVPLMAS